MYNAKFSKTFFKRIIEAQSWFFNYVLKQSIIINIHLKLSSNPIFIKPSISYQKLRNQIYLLLINQGILPFLLYLSFNILYNMDKQYTLTSNKHVITCELLETCINFHGSFMRDVKRALR